MPRTARFALILAIFVIASCETPLQAPVDDECPPWAEYPRDRSGNTGSPYLGCNNTVNLRRMVQDPTDLLRGRKPGLSDGNREADSVQRYKDGETKPLPSLSTTPQTSTTPGAPSPGTTR